MNQRKSIDVARITAFDVHVHIEHEGHDTTVEQAAKKYFGGGSAERDHAALADYYRSRKMACIVFSVDETLSRRPVVSNDQVADLARATPILPSLLPASTRIAVRRPSPRRDDWWPPAGFTA